jgi:alpha-beta hydrolase superfamily lysophospholipase
MPASFGFPNLPQSWREESFKVCQDKISVKIYRKADVRLGRLLFIVHGHGEHGGRYEHFPFFLQSEVDAVATFDLPGHGLSAGRKGFVENFDEYTEAALEAFTASQSWMTKESGKCKAHWLGHSLGGLITLRTLIKNTDLPLRSVIASAPLLDLAFAVPVFKRFMGQLLAPIWGHLPLKSEIDSTLLSHDPEVSKLYKEDPLNHSIATPKFFINMVKETTAIRSGPQTLNYNFLMVTPLADQIVSWPAQLQFFKDLKAKKKKLASFPAFRHEAFNEIGKERVFNALSDWIRENDY